MDRQRRARPVHRAPATPPPRARIDAGCLLRHTLQLAATRRRIRVARDPVPRRRAAAPDRWKRLACFIRRGASSASHRFVRQAGCGNATVAMSRPRTGISASTPPTSTATSRPKLSQTPRAACVRWAGPGFNCSIPHKLSVVEHLDEPRRHGGRARRRQLRRAARGPIHPREHRGAGFLAALRTVADPAGKSFVVLGAGGAARAIAVRAGSRRGAVITIRSRHAVCAPSSAARSAPLTAEGHRRRRRAGQPDTAFGNGQRHAGARSPAG
jgi:hypothetical protein